MAAAKPVFLLDGESLTPEDLTRLAHGEYTLDLSPVAWKRVGASRALIEQLATRPTPTYGVNTGFGAFSNVSIDADKLSQLQVNLITSHAAGTGSPISPARTRLLLVLRINVFAKGHSGISPENVVKCLAAYNAGVLPFVPELGTVGASGDLAPLAHLALGLMGLGKAWDSTLGQYDDAGKVLARHNLEPLTLGPKEGLALINGTQFIVAHGVEALTRATHLARLADVVGALSLEALQGTPRAFDPRIHAARGHTGQQASAARLRALLHRPDNHSQIYDNHLNCTRVQDAYSLRCMPQVHGVANDTLAMVRQILTTEMNAATDNPMIFAEQSDIVSGGNFHGQFPAAFLDYLCIGVHELGSISERRLDRLCNPALSGLPAFLVKQGGLNSGFMIAHCTAAALVAENRQLCTPASVDTIPTSAGKEDHVSMGGWAARKALRVVANTERILAIELLAAAQGIESHRPLQTTPLLERIHALVRTVAQPWDCDRYMAPDIDAVLKLVRSGAVWNTIAEAIGEESVDPRTLGVDNDASPAVAP